MIVKILNLQQVSIIRVRLNITKEGKFMRLDDIEDVNVFLHDIENLFTNLDDIKNKLETEIEQKNAIQEDYLHELELSQLNRMELLGTTKKLIQTRKERRVLKDKLELINTIKGYTDKYIIKGIVADTKQAICNINTLKKNQATRQYTPRILKDLKCAKKKREE